jgi:prepilin-type N-terminal cleavage/methylation domain-containing protein
MSINNPSNDRGDTIIEVLIAIAVVSLVLVTAYATSTRNVSVMQDTQEHSEALQLAQTQLEFLHNAAGASDIPSSGGCFDKTGDPANLVEQNPNPACIVDATGSPTTAQPQFKIEVNSEYCPVTFLDNYTVEVTWPSLLGGQTNNVVTLYYQQQAST